MKRWSWFSMEKYETEEVNAHVTLATDHLYYKIHSSGDFWKIDFTKYFCKL